MNKEALLKTGTTTVGLVCKDGIVLAADKRASTDMISSKKEVKIVEITDNAAITTAGLVSDIQLLTKLVKAEVKLKDLQVNRKATISEIANLLGGLMYSNIRKFSTIPGIVGFLLGGKDDEGNHLYDLGPDGSVTKHDDYSSEGSGSVFALGVLESTYKKGLSVDEGVKLAVKSINTAIQRDYHSGNGVDVITITEKGIQWVVRKELNPVLEA
ncbi:proteasome subunit beta [Candidatus Woesearchaeota archaeon]|nr:proteasome subunit beta [Candidatus Woesearchaeota archaeon]